MKIIVVDDSLLERKLLINILIKNNVQHEILQATNGQQALEILSQNYKEVSLILLDWQMPEMDGLEFMKGVLKVPAVANIPIVMVTASGSDENKKIAYEINPRLAGYVIKPYKPDTLMGVIKPCLSSTIGS